MFVLCEVEVHGSAKAIQRGAEALRRQGCHRVLLRRTCRSRQQSQGTPAEVIVLFYL